MSPISSQPLETSSASLIGCASVTSVPIALHDPALVARPQRLLLEEGGDRRDVAVQRGLVDHARDGAVAGRPLQPEDLGVDRILGRGSTGRASAGASVRDTAADLTICAADANSPGT
jgi:hypothetical protein